MPPKWSAKGSLYLTYKELKQQLWYNLEWIKECICLYLTYKELKLKISVLIAVLGQGLYLTYKELKHSEKLEISPVKILFISYL